MSSRHPNVDLIERLDLRNLETAAEIFAPDIVWHFFNPRLVQLQGDYVGLNGIRSFFETLAKVTNGTFNAEPISLMPIGDQLVVGHTRNSLTLAHQQIITDVVIVWRIVDGKITEVWDIPTV